MSRKPVEPAKKEQNEYIPSFISKKPFYLESAEGENDYLEHQRLQGTPIDQTKWYDRGKRVGPAATKYRKGACENCGAMTHKTRDCLSRPRAKGAKWTGRDIQADEIVQDVQLGWDAKRDRWNGYDAGEFQNIVEDFEELDKLKKQMKEGKERGADSTPIENGDSRQLQTEEEAKYAEESDMGRQQSNATRNLRIREDTAKYLLNLDLESAKYDPKTRSMVDMGAQADEAAALVAEDNFMRASGDAAEFERAQKYAWETQERGDKNKLHLQANPTSGEYFRRKEQKERDEKRGEQKKALLEKYGGEQHLQPNEARNIAVVESDKYAEYDNFGGVKGLPKTEEKSKYPEDVFPNNHTSVWGSWWSDFQWGYSCCHSIVKNSYCTGEDGKRAFDEVGDVSYITGAPSEHAENAENGTIITNDLAENDNGGKHDRVQKRTLLEMKDGVSEDAMEAYKRSRLSSGDPMAKFLGQGQLVT